MGSWKTKKNIQNLYASNFFQHLEKNYDLENTKALKIENTEKKGLSKKQVAGFFSSSNANFGIKEKVLIVCWYTYKICYFGPDICIYSFNHIHLYTLLSLNFNEHILKTDTE